MRRALVLLLLLLTGCEATQRSYSVTAEFTDVLDLVPMAAVKVNDVTVGSVEEITLRGFVAVVRMKLSEGVDLPDNATAAIRQSSLLGEKFVALAAPAGQAGQAGQGKLGNGDLIGLDRTRQGAEVEEVLAALGLLLNGGGLAQLKTINQEVVKALTGREGDAKGALHELDRFITGLDAQKAEIVKTIEALDRLAAGLATQTEVIGNALDALAPGLTVLAQQREQLTDALVALRDLSEVGVRVIDASAKDTVASLKALQPILDNLVAAGDALPKGIDFALTFPFPPNAQKAITGDFVRLHATLDLDAASILANLMASAGGAPLPALPQLPLPQLPTLPLPSLPPLPLPSLPPLPLPTVLPSGLLPSLPGLPPILPGVRLGRSDPMTGEVAGMRGGLSALLIGGEPA
ncbi:ABC transporter substrate-binding protein [Rhizocola hellebori]|uniref:ABC transporter substrate-binding protein n=1 Tax=Rhizocola hellebori TaxID=1392758 RepID=A0A8J3Q7S7_9ACTN|nr:MCE family protein [Rhizocola hellebori]GIH04640.1 ABC transporter substrate-binding protein [Rhizocola hellebori]